MGKITRWCVKRERWASRWNNTTWQWLTHSTCLLSHRTYEDVRCQSDGCEREAGISIDGGKTTENGHSAFCAIVDKVVNLKEEFWKIARNGTKSEGMRLLSCNCCNGTLVCVLFCAVPLYCCLVLTSCGRLSAHKATFIQRSSVLTAEERCLCCQRTSRQHQICSEKFSL